VPRPHVLIIGAGFGGLEAARTLARAPVDITLVDRRNHHLFQPPLYQVATAALSPGDIAWPVRSIFRRRPNVTVLLAEVEGIGSRRRLVQLGARRYISAGKDDFRTGNGLEPRKNRGSASLGLCRPSAQNLACRLLGDDQGAFEPPPPSGAGGYLRVDQRRSAEDDVFRNGPRGRRQGGAPPHPAAMRRQ
jgi:hypothetical protein